MTNGGEPIENPLSPRQVKFLSKIAHPCLNAVTDNDTLKHFADVWWNLCLWEKQRADVLDGKAQTLIGLATIASAVVTVAVPVVGSDGPGAGLRVAAVVAFLLTASLAVWSLRIAEYGGFLDTDVFGALTIATVPAGPIPAFDDKDPFRSYLREITMQRWLIYNSFKSASSVKADRVEKAQWLAIVAIALLVISVLIAV